MKNNRRKADGTNPLASITRLDIGCGAVPLDGFEPWDVAQSRRAESLEGIADGQLDAIHASHVLEHLSHRDTVAVLREWARALRIGGELLVAVPDFDKLVKAYVEGASAEVEPRLMGGHLDENDCHYAIFNRQKLTEALAAAGFDVVDDWKGIEGHCSSDWCSMNLRAVKRGKRRYPVSPMPDAICLMSMPRLAWTDNMTCMVDACSRLRMPFVRATGVFWGQSLERMMSEVVAEGKHRWIVTCDYDSVFTAQDIVALRAIAEENGLDALAPLQVARDRDDILAKLDDGTGAPRKTLGQSELESPFWPCLHAHFGLTLIRVEALRRMPHPWFIGHPDADGNWGDGRVDDDIHFWKVARESGWRCAITPQVVIGHLQVLVSWPSDELRPTHQYVRDYQKKGRPQWNIGTGSPASS